MTTTSKFSIAVRSADMNGEYKVPSMKEIEAIPWNGFNVVSTFSGGGGSCLGYRMAGYRVLYANEFVEEAQRTYKANHPNSYLDTRDIRTVSAESILEITGMKRGEIDIFDGSPPCCAFSTAGKREDGWNHENSYSDGKTQRADDLFFEYARLLNGLQPKVFVAENVSGLVKGKAKGYFKLILRALKDCGYEVTARLVDAKWLGVPQSRQRLIFVGVRKDLVEEFDVHPVHPTPFAELVSLEEALRTVENNADELEYVREEMDHYKIGNVLKIIPKNPPRAISADKYMNGSYFNLIRESMFTPCSTICQMNGVPGRSGNCHPLEDRKFTVSELRRITSIPDDFILTGDYRQQWERLGRMVPPLMMKAIASTIAKEILCKI